MDPHTLPIRPAAIFRYGLVALLFSFILQAQAQTRDAEFLLQDVTPNASEELTELTELQNEVSIRELGDSVQVWVVPGESSAEFRESLGALTQEFGIQAFELSGHYTDVLAPQQFVGDLSPTQQTILSDAIRSNEDAAYTLVELPPLPIVRYALSSGFDAEDGFQASGAISIPLTDGTSVHAVRERLEIRNGNQLWSGRIAAALIDGEMNEATGYVTLIASENSMSGTVNFDGRLFSIRPLGGGLHALFEKNALPEEHPPENESAFDGDQLRFDVPPPRGALPPGPHEVGVLVAYTPGVASLYVDVYRDLILLAIEETNVSFVNSGIDSHIRLRDVSTHQVTYNESAHSWDEHLQLLVGESDSIMDELHELRTAIGGDIVVLLLDDNSWCGEASEIFADERSAFVVVYHACATGYYSFGHELGHLFGARHDRQMDPSSSPFPHGHGYVNGGSWRTIMAYGNSCNNCSREPVWSGPDVLLHGVPAGTAQYEHNARVLAEGAYRISLFR